jgi:hypothetical protein
MDTKIIQQYGQDILCYQIKSKRRKIRGQKKGEDKRLIRLNREWDQIRHKQRNLGYVDLVPPIVRGWKRYFILREDVSRSRHADFYQKILNKINTEHYSYRKDFKKKKRQRGKKIWMVQGQRLAELEEYLFKKEKFTEKETALFEEKYIAMGRGNYKKLVKVFVFKEPWRFVLRVRPNLITKVKAVDLELEKRSAEISDYLGWNALWGTFSRLIHGSHHNGWGRYGTKKWQSKNLAKYQCKQKSLQQLLNEEWHNK